MSAPASPRTSRRCSAASPAGAPASGRRHPDGAGFPRSPIPPLPEGRRTPCPTTTTPSRRPLNRPLFPAAGTEPPLDIHPADAAPRNIKPGDWVRIFNDRGAFGARARVSDKARPGCVVAVSLWWRKLTPDGTNANQVTSQRLADMGNAATFYDALVDVAPAPEPAAAPPA